MRRGGLILGAILIATLAIPVFFYTHTPSQLEQTRTDLIGSWRSVQDAKFTREFKNDGKVSDAYGGSAIQGEGRWILFTKDMPPEGYTGTLEDGVYLAVGAPQSEMLYFKITRMEPRTLELTYLNRGGVLTFEKI